MITRFRWVLLSLMLAGVFTLLYTRWRLQHGYGYFRYPVDLDLQLAANFGELREDHFHMGVDIRTLGREGLPVYAAADGYISRIEVQAGGLGHALYIRHPNGMTTVYGHLRNFTGEVEEYTRAQQYGHERWDQRIDLPADRWPVKKGDLIAWSGNTGASRAPHLHFEVLDTRTGKHLNPQLLGLAVEDRLPPMINGLYWYDRTISTYATRARKIALKGGGAEYRTAEEIVRVSSPLVSLGIQVTDKTSPASHLSGIYGASLRLDDSLIFDYSLDDCMPADTRYINASIDYTKWVRSHVYVSHLSVLPGNRATAFRRSGKDGMIRLRDHLVHRVSIRVRDVAGNMSVLEMKLQFTGVSEVVQRGADADVYVLRPGKEVTLRGPSCAVHFSADAFYDEVPFRMQEQWVRGAGRISPVLILHDMTVPVHDAYTVMMETRLPLESPLRQRTVMQLLSGDSQYIVKGVWQNGRMAGRFNRLGMVQLLVDTIAPVAAAKGWVDGEALPAGATGISIACRDDLGPVATFRGEIDGHWVPFAPQGDVYTYTIDGRCGKGTHRLRIVCTDVAGNEMRRDYGFNIQ